MKIYAMISRDLDTDELSVETYTNYEKLLAAFDIEITHANDEGFEIEECLRKPVESGDLYLRTAGYEIVGQQCQLY